MLAQRAANYVFQLFPMARKNNLPKGRGPMSLINTPLDWLIAIIVDDKRSILDSVRYKGHARLCLTEARVPSFNGEKADLKPAITSFYMYFYVIPFFSPLKLGTRASLRHESVTALRSCQTMPH